MKIQISKKDLAPDVTVAQAAADRGAAPVTGTILVEGKDGKLTLSATNLDLGYRVTLPAAVEGEGGMCLNAEKFSAIIGSLPDAPVEIEITDTGASVRCERSHFKLLGIPREKFPELPVPHGGPRVQLTCPLFSEMIRHTDFAITKEASRYALNGALFRSQGGKLIMVATDGHRLALLELKVDVPDINILLPKNMLNFFGKVKSLAEATTPLILQVDDNYIFFTLDNRLLVSRRLTGNFPAHEAVMPKDLPGFAELDARTFLAALRRVALMADDRSHGISLNITAGQIEIATRNSETGDAQDALLAETREQLNVGFNYTYLIDFLAAVGGGKVRLEFKAADSPARLIVCPDPDPEKKAAFEYQYVVMPLRV